MYTIPDKRKETYNNNNNNNNNKFYNFMVVTIK